MILTKSERRVQIIAHRGASFDAPENTLASVNLGWQKNADAVEVDVHLSVDGHLIVMHDANTFRTTGKNNLIKDTSLPALKKLDAGLWKGAQWKGEAIPTLAEVLDTLPDNRRLVVEIKSGLKCLDPLENLIMQKGIKPDQLVLMEFDYDTVIAAKERFPQYTVLWLIEFEPGSKDAAVQEKLTEAHRIVRSTKLNGLNIEASRQITSAYVEKLSTDGFDCYTWTVDNPTDAAYFIETGVCALTTNCPDWLRKQLENQI